MSDLRAVVIGGAGFIGSHLVDALLSDVGRVTVIDNFSTGRPQNLSHVNNSVEIIEADISETGPWQHVVGHADWVFHLGALADIVPSIQQPHAYYRSNVNGTFNVLEATRGGSPKKSCTQRLRAVTESPMRIRPPKRQRFDPSIRMP